MQAVVVFESMFGNTEAIARAVAEGLSSRMTVDVVEVDRARTVVSDDVDLVVLGAPTHAFGLSRERTRTDATGRDGSRQASTWIGIREWLAVASRRSPNGKAAAFDTRVRTPHLPGSAARAACRRLRRLGFDVIAPPESFYVADLPGPLLAGETERAREWGVSLAAALAAASPARPPACSAL
jgi:hypothetical protein